MSSSVRNGFSIFSCGCNHTNLSTKLTAKVSFFFEYVITINKKRIHISKNVDSLY